ncbi:MAG: hypothetical protein ACTSWG_14285 [Candidatus Helarchaeota archaeon]
MIEFPELIKEIFKEITISQGIVGESIYRLFKITDINSKTKSECL